MSEARAPQIPAAPPSTTPAHVPWAAVAVFLVVAFGLAWLVALPLWLSGKGLDTPGALVLLVAMMYTPTIGAIAALLRVQRPGLSAALRGLGLWPLGPIWRTVGFAAGAVFGTVLIVVAGAFLAAALGAVRLDLVAFSGFAELLRTSTNGAQLPVPIGVLVLVQIVSIPIGAVINVAATLGEEIGWRGWLLPALRPLGTWPALVLSGAIWGLWHSPVILLGYNFGRTDALGVVMMTGACILVGVLFGWLRLRTGSVWPSAFAHGALNASGGFLALIAAAGSTVDPIVAGPLGLVTWLVLAVVIAGLALAGQFRIQPQLEPVMGAR